MPNPAEIYEEEQSFVQLALDNFAALLDDVDFSAELALLGIGRLQFLRRRQMLVELRGLYIALWRLALGRSFPNDADTMLSVFLHRYLMTNNDKLAPQQNAAGNTGACWNRLATATSPLLPNT